MPWIREHWKLNRIELSQAPVRPCVTGAGMTRKTVHAEGSGGILTHFVIITWVVLQNLFQQSAVFLELHALLESQPCLSVPTSTSSGTTVWPSPFRLYVMPSRCPPVHTHRKFPSAVPPSSWKYSHFFGTEFSLVSCIQSIKLDNFFLKHTFSGFPFTSVLTKASWPPCWGFPIASPCGFLPFPQTPF